MIDSAKPWLKVSISHKAYFKLPDGYKSLWDEIRLQMYYEVETQGRHRAIRSFQNCGRVGEDMYWIPVTRVQSVLSKYFRLQIVDRRVEIPVEIPAPKFTLRPDQDEIAQEYLSGNDDCAIINGKPGFGKTILALYLAYKLKQKTLIITTNLNIRSQWEREIRRHFGFTAGVIGSGKFITDPPIVVANIQTLVKHSEKLRRVFGLVIVDEMHHCVASTFSSFLEFSAARYKIGLSGTLKRRDGLNVMFKDFFGYKVFKPTVNNTVPPKIMIRNLSDRIKIQSQNSMTPWGDRANSVYNNEEYQNHLISSTYVMYRAGHKVLLVSDRVWLQELAYESLKEVGADVRMITGTTEEDIRIRNLEYIRDSKTPCILIGTQSIFSEGVSCDPLSCLVLGALIGDNEALIEQLIGRIQRIYPNKPQPVVIDTVLGSNTGLQQAGHRRTVYWENDWESKEYNDEKWEEFVNKTLEENKVEDLSVTV